MQFNRKADGSLEGLPAKVIDTGMGFERLVRTLQGKTSNYDTDVFQPLIAAMADMAGCKYGDDEKKDIALRVIVDHVRAIAFAIADGQLPSNAKAGYVIRRILRRAVRYGYTFLGQKEAFIYKLVPTLVAEMGDAFPELPAQQKLIMKVMQEEESSFLRTLEKGIILLQNVIDQTKAAGKTEIAGNEAFTLFDTYGFPLDLTELICREQNMTLDEAGFNKCMEEQKNRARNAAEENRIILHRVRWCDHCRKTITGGEQIVGFSVQKIKENKIYNHRIMCFEELFLKYCSQSKVLDLNNQNFVADEKHVWGLSPVHYENGYYETAARELENLISE